MIYENIDIALCNEKRKVEFIDAHVKVLTRLKFSDHHPIIINTDNNQNHGAPILFKFESAWILVGSYQDMINAA